jgi:protein TonB
MPEFPGGQAALMKWLSNNIRYPQIALDNGISGRVVVKFVVEKDGSVGNVQVVKGVDKDLDKEAMRVVRAMPKWQPGKNNGQAVRCYYNLPVTFKIQEQ